MTENAPGFAEERLPESAFSMRFGRTIMRNRFATLMTLLSITLFFAVPLVNAIVVNTGGEPLLGLQSRFRMDTRARDQWPEHPFIHAVDKFAGRFGTASYVSIAVVKKDGEIYDVDFLEKVDRVTKRADEAPFVNHYQVQSIAHINTRVIGVEPDGALTAEPLMEEVPPEEELPAFKELVHENPGRIYGYLVSRDDTATQIGVGFITHRLDNRKAYEDVFNYFRKIEEEEEADGTADIYLSGFPVLIGWTYLHAYEVALFLLATIVLLFFLLLLYFRRLHGVAIPFVAGLSTAIWGMGFCAWVGIALDPLILVIPLLITARSISHTIQMAERFFEEFEMEVGARQRRLGRSLTPAETDDAKVESATTSMAKLMLPGMLGIITDAAGLLVILITTIQQMWNLGIFGSFWVVAIIFNVILLHPIMIAYLPPPHDYKHYTPRWINALLNGAGRLTTSSPAKYVLIGVSAAIFAVATWYVLFNSTIGDARPGTPLFWEDHPYNVATAEIAKRFGGVDQFTIFVDGDQKGSSADGAVLQRMEAMERYVKKFADPGAVISLVNIIRVFWETNHYGDPKWGFVPDSAGAIARVVFQLQQSSTPGALRPYLTDEQEDANITFYFGDHRGDTIRKAVHFTDEFIHENPMGRLSVRLVQPPSPFLDGVYYMLGPLLPPRARYMHIQQAILDEEQETKGYTRLAAQPAGRWTDPAPREEVEKRVIEAIGALGNKKVAEITLASSLKDDLKLRRDVLEKVAIKLSADFDYRVESVREAEEVIARRWLEEGATVQTIVDYIVARSEVYVVEEWIDPEQVITAQTVRFCRHYCDYELWVKNVKFKDSSYNPQPTGSWTRGAEFVMAGGIMGILAAVNEEVERGHVANILLIFLICYAFVAISYRSNAAGLVIMYSLAMATILSLFYMAARGTGLNINTLPVQSVGVGIGVDYALYITDRIRQEYSWTGDLDEGIRRAIRTTGMAVSFTATTLVGGIGAWVFSNLRFQAEMALLLAILMIVNMLGAILLVPALFSIVRPAFFAASLSDQTEQPKVETARQAAAGGA